MGDHEGARLSYQRVLELSEDAEVTGDASALSARCWSLFKLGEIDEATRLYDFAIRVDENDPSTRFDLALVLLHSGRARIAHSEFTRAVEETQRKHPWRQRGLLQVAGYELEQVLGESPALAEEPPVKAIQKLWQQALEAARSGAPPLPQ